MAKNCNNPTRYYATKQELNQALVDQLYDEWHGWYLLKKLFMGRYIDVRVLSRSEALTYRIAKDEALELKHFRPSRSEPVDRADDNRRDDRQSDNDQESV